MLTDIFKKKNEETEVKKDNSKEKSYEVFAGNWIGVNS